MKAKLLPKPLTFSLQPSAFANSIFAPQPFPPPPNQQTEAESTSYHWMRERNTSAHTIILRENAGFKSALLPRLVGFEGNISLPPPPFFPFSSWFADGSVPFFYFFLVVVVSPPTGSHQWDDTLHPAAWINIQGGRN